jgi:hypothetical protein
MNKTFATAILRALRPATVLALSLCIAVFLFRSIHWPLLGDASLLHYVVFLAKHGATPYRDSRDEHARKLLCGMGRHASFRRRRTRVAGL